MTAEVEERGPIPNLALNAILIPVFEETALVNIHTLTYSHTAHILFCIKCI